MPRPKGKSTNSTGINSKGQGVAGFFRPIFAANKKLLKTRSNKQVLAMWLAANPDHQEVPNNVKVGLANLKSTMRSKIRKRRSKKAALEVASDTAVAKSKTALPLSNDAADAGLERLEMLIDESLTLARNIDRKGSLANVVMALRIARNRVVWKLGED
jgi:hypothetical protein